jgi:hypothetical protein
MATLSLPPPADPDPHQQPDATADPAGKHELNRDDELIDVRHRSFPRFCSEPVAHLLRHKIVAFLIRRNNENSQGNTSRVS